MEKIITAIEELKKINVHYDLPNTILDATKQEIESAKVCTPIIGKFSSGKSAAFNTLLGYSRKVLKEDITPETAVPTEIVFNEIESNKPVTILYNNGETEICALSNFREKYLDASTTKCAKLLLKNSFMGTIKDVMLVDMPGFESGLEVHNRAIDTYLPESLAYMVAFPADDMVLRSSIGNILKELCLHEMPICIVITKCDKVDEDTLNTNLENLRKNLKRFIGERKVNWCLTSSFNGEVEELKTFLLNVQENSQEILARKFSKRLESSINVTEQYLTSIMKNSELSESELIEKEDDLNTQIEKLSKNVLKASYDFENQMSSCIDGIKVDVLSALRAEESTFVAMVLNNQSIKEQVNVIVRIAVTNSLQKRFIPVVKKYIDNVSNNINVDAITSMGVMMNIDMDKMEKNMVGSTVAGVAAGLLIGLPLILGIITVIIAGISKFINNKKREEAKAQIRQRLNTEVFPNIVQQVGVSVEREIKKQIIEIKNTINEKITMQRNVLQKALDDLKNQQNKEKQKKDNLQIDVQNDLNKIGEIKNELR